MSETNNTQTTSTGLILSSKRYNQIKWFLFVFLPAFSTAYSSASIIFGFGYVAYVVGGSGVLGLFLGTILGVSNKNFQKNGADGSMSAYIDEESKTVILSSLVLPNITPEELAKKDSVTVQVNQLGSSQ